MKYRIIGERDQNGNGHFEAHYLRSFLGIRVWSPLCTFGFGAYMVARFDTCKEAEDAVIKFIRSRIKARVVVAGGEVTAP